MNAISKPEGPALPILVVGDGAVQVERISGHGAARANLSLRLDGRRIAEGEVTRDQLMGYALELLALCDHLVDDRAYGSSDTMKSGRAAVSARHEDGLKRYYRLLDRIPILQLAQRVLEGADDETATTLLTLLASVDATGKLPIRVEVDFKAAQEHSGGSTH